jgi:hypothetical protein
MLVVVVAAVHTSVSRYCLVLCHGPERYSLGMRVSLFPCTNCTSRSAGQWYAISSGIIERLLFSIFKYSSAVKLDHWILLSSEAFSARFDKSNRSTPSPGVP